MESMAEGICARLGRDNDDIGSCMIHLNLSRGAAEALQILCLGSHSDDIEIGCGGTILRLAEQYPARVFHWVVFSAIGVRETEAKRAAEMFAGPTGLRGPLLKTFPDGFMPFVGAEVKEVFEGLKRSVSPDLIFTHNRKDAHQDHRLIAEYEIPKYDGDLGQPGLFVPLQPEVCQRKARYIIDAFQSQHSKRWFREDTFLSLMRLRGMECNAPSGYAEAFFCRKMVL